MINYKKSLFDYGVLTILILTVITLIPLQSVDAHCKVLHPKHCLEKTKEAVEDVGGDVVDVVKDGGKDVSDEFEDVGEDVSDW